MCAVVDDRLAGGSLSRVHSRGVATMHAGTLTYTQALPVALLTALQ